jgi:hypothetical protein
LTGWPRADGGVIFTVLAAAVGLIIGLLAGGSLKRLGERRFRLWPLLPLGVVLQLPFVDRLGFGGLLASYACLLAFALANIRLVGMGLVAVGIGLNTVPIAVNGGMPVDRDAIVEARITSTAGLRTLHLDRKHHLERDSDTLTVLADIIPVRPLKEVISFGDVVLAVGVADVIYHLLRPRLRHAVREEP